MPCFEWEKLSDDGGMTDGEEPAYLVVQGLVWILGLCG